MKFDCCNCSVSPSISEIADALECSFEIESLAGDKELYREMCRIIADVLTLHPDCLMYVAKQKRTARNVQEVYGMLTSDHIEMVADKFKKCTYEIKNRVGWMHSALYNAPMEFNSYYTNKVSTDFGG